jgi:stearoyl-CoA desaturase (delta-9 desaturase)
MSLSISPRLVPAVRFIGIHLVAVIGTVVTGITTEAAICFLVAYAINMFAVSAGYHRYFSHRTFKTSRAMQFVFAWFAQATAQKSVIWWARQHRHHHKYSDQPEDVHSPAQRGFWYSHVIWLFDPDQHSTERVPDLEKFPELRFLDRWWLLPPVVNGAIVFWFLGWPGLMFGWFGCMVFTWHATFTINSLSHVYGTVRYQTGDTSKNNWWLALLTFGEGWHNNHHHYMSSTRQGFFWWEYDITYYLLTALSWTGLVWDLRPVPEKLLRRELVAP